MGLFVEWIVDCVGFSVIVIIVGLILMMILMGCVSLLNGVVDVEKVMIYVEEVLD